MEILQITHVIYLLSSLLFYPVIIALLLLACWMLVCLGEFARESLQRRKKRFHVRAKYTAQCDALIEAQSGAHLEIDLEEVIHDADQQSTRALDSVRFAIRVGPSLGLIGTLIPMAGALQGLSQGDLPALSGNMVTAFSTTVLGLAVGTVAYVLALVKEKWVREDIQALAFHVERRHGQVRSIPEQVF